jgi:hypothetical protein
LSGAGGPANLTGRKNVSLGNEFADFPVLDSASGTGALMQWGAGCEHLVHGVCEHLVHGGEFADVDGEEAVVYREENRTAIAQ